MSTVPSTLIIKLVDIVNFNMNEALTVMREMFSYGVKDITHKGNKIYIQLTYTPRHKTLQYKFGNLPIQYLRTKMENEHDLKVFEKCMRKFTFHLRAEEEDEDSTATTTTAALKAGPSSKKPLAGPSSSTPAKRLLFEDDEDDDEPDENILSQKKLKLPPLDLEDSEDVSPPSLTTKKRPLLNLYRVMDNNNVMRPIPPPTPELINGVWTPPKLVDISANLISLMIDSLADINLLEIPAACKSSIYMQYCKYNYEVLSIDELPDTFRKKLYL